MKNRPPDRQDKLRDCAATFQKFTDAFELMIWLKERHLLALSAPVESLAFQFANERASDIAREAFGQVFKKV